MPQNFRVWQLAEGVSGIQHGASPPNDTDPFAISSHTTPFTRPLRMLTCITLFSFATTTFAAPSENKDQANCKAEMLKKFDKDGDGKLSDDERNAVREAIKASRSKGEQRQEKKK